MDLAVEVMVVGEVKAGTGGWGYEAGRVGLGAVAVDMVLVAAASTTAEGKALVEVVLTMVMVVLDMVVMASAQVFVELGVRQLDKQVGEEVVISGIIASNLEVTDSLLKMLEIKLIKSVLRIRKTSYLIIKLMEMLTR